MRSVLQSSVNSLGMLLVGALTLSVASIGHSQPIQDEVSYTNDIRPIVKTFCTTCHAGDDPDGDFVLTSYEDVRYQIEFGELLHRINDEDEPMPEDGLMPNHLRRMFEMWEEGGFINEGSQKASVAQHDYMKFEPPEIIPVDVSRKGFDLLEKMQGHWVGSMNLMGRDMPWMAFDYRAIAPSHVHGMFEGGTIGNLFTSFFVTTFKGKKTIMARNGGLLNGIYRTSYFVLDQVEYGDGWSYYRLVDAYGGKGIMWMELTFSGDGLEFNSYTSRFGMKEPNLHMAFQGKRMHMELAEAAAKAVGFPQNIVDFDFSKGLPTPTWANEYPQTSASYIWDSDGASKPLLELAKLSLDPYRIDQMPHVAKLTVDIERNRSIEDQNLLVYLSRDALTDQRGKFITEYGYLRADLADGLLLFPDITGKQDAFTFTYLHPGKYYLTVIADMNGDGFPSPGDITHARKAISVSPKSHDQVSVKNITVKN